MITSRNSKGISKLFCYILVIAMVAGNVLPGMTKIVHAKQLEKWEINKAYNVGDQVVYEDEMYECLQSHRSISTWNPKDARSLWKYITGSGEKPDTGNPDTGKPTQPDSKDISFKIVSDWGSGMTANIEIKNNTKQVIKDWVITFNLDEKATIQSSWNGHLSEKGNEITIKNAGWNKTIQPGGKVNIGLSISYRGTFIAPKDFKLNGLPVEPVVPEKPEPVVPEKPEPVVPEKPEPVVPEKPEPVVPEKPEPVVPEKPEPVVPEKPEPVNPEKPSGDNYYVGYFQSWSDRWASSGEKTDLANLPKYVNVVMLAFGKPDMQYNGNLDLSGTGLQFSYDGKVLKEAIQTLKTKNPDTKVILSIGGLTYTNWSNINVNAISKLVKDFDLDGVDLDYEPAGGFNTRYDENGKITYDKAGEYVSIIKNMRKAMPRPKLLVATGWSVGAYGEDQWKNAKPGPFASTGMMLPIMREAGKDLDMINVMGYNAGEYDGIDAIKAFKNYFDGPVNMGVMVPPEDWGGHVWTLDKVAKTAKYVNANKTGGMMIWSLQRNAGGSTYEKPSAQMMSTLIAQELQLAESSKPLFPLSNPNYTSPWGDKYPYKDDNTVKPDPDNGGKEEEDLDKVVLDRGLLLEKKSMEQKDNSFKTEFTVKNPNTSYKYDGSIYNVWSLSFETSANVTGVTGAKNYKQDGNKVVIELLDYEKNIPLGEARKIVVSFNKAGDKNEPSNMDVKFMRGKDMYPVRSTLPSNFSKGSTAYKSSDLITNETAYYKQNVGAINDGIILYNPPTDTQITIGLAEDVYTNLTGGIKMWIPSKYMAMGLGFAQEFFGINPNYMAALGTKENFAAGVYPTVEGAFRHPVFIKGKTWYWGMTSGSVDGPFQQETPNFNETKDFFPDLFAGSAQHDDYTNVAEDINDKKFIKATLASAASLTMTREFMFAVPSYEFGKFVKEAKDPNSESVLLTYAYNRGLYSVDGKVFREDRQANLNSTDLMKKLGYAGFADHVPQVLGMMEAMNKEINDIYDIKLTKDDIDVFMEELRAFYPYGVPSDQQWKAMTDDVNKAFDTLSKHWNDGTISYRYDFLTLVRVMKTYLPSDIPPAPKGENFGYQVINRNTAK